MDDSLTEPIKAHHSPLAARIDELLGDRTAVEVALIERIAGNFAGKAPGMIASIEAAVRDGDPAAVAYHAHALKGSVANLGVHEIADLCATIEELGRSGDTGAAAAHTAGLGPILDRAATELTDTVTALSRRSPEAR